MTIQQIMQHKKAKNFYLGPNYLCIRLIAVNYHMTIIN